MEVPLESRYVSEVQIDNNKPDQISLMRVCNGASKGVCLECVESWVRACHKLKHFFLLLLSNLRNLNCFDCITKRNFREIRIHFRKCFSMISKQLKPISYYINYTFQVKITVQYFYGKLIEMHIQEKVQQYVYKKIQTITIEIHISFLFFIFNYAFTRIFLYFPKSTHILVKI